MAPKAAPKPVLAHVLFMDIVGSSRLPSDEQERIVGRLKELVRQSPQFERSREADQLISLPTGDGMAIAFFNDLDAAVVCAVEVTQAIQAESLCRIRMGVHTGLVFITEDINGKRNLSGVGINLAERVMSCGGAGHILLSNNVAESLRHLSAWRDKIQDVGECQVKDGWVHVWNLVDGAIGNRSLPKNAKRFLQHRRMRIAVAITALSLILVGVAVAAGVWIGSFHHSDKSIAVLPFEDLNSEKGQEYLPEGLADELRGELGKILQVSGKRSSSQFEGKNLDARVIGEKLKVATLLEGSVRTQGDRVKITVQLIKAADGLNLWAQTYDRELNDVFSVEDEITREVIGKLLGKKPPQSEKSSNPDAYKAYLQGQYFGKRLSQENMQKAVNYFQQAITVDPRYAPAWAALGEYLRRQASAGYVPREEGYRKARQAIEQALILDPNLADALVAMGMMRMYDDWNWAGADDCFKRALAQDPSNVRQLGARGAWIESWGA